MSVKVTVSSRWNGTPVKIAGKRVVGKSAFEIGFVVAGQAKALAPVDTGLLAASITVASSTEQTAPDRPSKFTKGSGITRGAGGESQAVFVPVIGKPTDDMEVLVGTPVDYGPHVEFGTVRSYAQPFLRPALDLAMGKTLTILQKHGRFEFAEYLEGKGA